MITIDSADDGIQAATYLYIISGTINIVTNGGAPATITEYSSDNANGKGLKAGTIEYVDENGNTVEITDHDWYAIVIDGGDITLNCNDDAVHSNGDMLIRGGNFTVASGDDAFYAEEILRIDAGILSISKCYEGVESAKIEIYGGDITVICTDNGINAADGTQNPVGQGNSNCYIYIADGNISVNSSGDGIDSNGVLIIEGGMVYVDGPVSGADAALDSDGGILINGGTVVAIGPLGMVETPGSNSKQCVISYASNSAVAAGSTICLKDSDGNVLIEFVTAKSCQSIILSVAELQIGGDYSIYNNDQLIKSFTVSDTITYIGTQNMGDRPGMPGGNMPGGDMPEGQIPGGNMPGGDMPGSQMPGNGGWGFGGGRQF